MPQEPEDGFARIKVIGIGGVGDHALNHMTARKLINVKFIFVDTDAQAVERNHAASKLLLRASASPDISGDASEDECSRIWEILQDTDMLLIVAGMGGDTGTRLAPIIAKVAKDMGIFTVALITLPPNPEEKSRLHHAEAGIADLRKFADSLFIFPRQKLIGEVDMKNSNVNPFSKADEMVFQTVRGITELLTQCTYAGIDFADVIMLLRDSIGVGEMGFGSASGDNRTTKAVESAIADMRLKNVDIHQARSVLVTVTGNEDTTLAEYDEATSIIHNMLDENADILSGMAFVPEAGVDFRVTLIVTGLSA